MSRRALAASFLITVSAGCAEPRSSEGPKADPAPASKGIATTATGTASAAPTTPKPSSSMWIGVNELGECVKQYACDPKCNPPGPRVVECPAAFTRKEPDGTCWYRRPTECAPDVDCNPPAPRKVKCPKGI